MAVATMMLILVGVLIRTAVRGVVIGMPGVMLVVIVGMDAHGSHVLPQVSIQPGRGRLGELERNDEHDDQDDDAAHGGILQIAPHLPRVVHTSTRCAS